jgi:glycerophosphoryl diester phosphodiesterase
VISLRPVFDGVLHDIRRSWKVLALTDIAYKMVAWIVLTPLVGLLFRVWLSVSGNTVLADQDILFFFLEPVGWFCIITVGALATAIVALEMSALLGILGESKRQRLGFLGGLQFALAHVWPVLQVTAPLIAFTLVTVAPFLVIAGLTYWGLLTEYDINYYLQKRPPTFWIAVGIGATLAVILVSVLLRLLTSWLFALPLVLFEQVRPAVALKTSRSRADGHRFKLLVGMVAWALAAAVVSTITTTAVLSLGWWIVPLATDSLAMLSLAIGGIMILWAGSGLAVNLLSTTTAASLLMNFYLIFGCSEEPAAVNQASANTQISASEFQLTRKRLLIGGIMGLVLALSISVYVLRSVQLEDHTEITAHRGSSYGAPENSLAAIRLAIAEGTDWVEIDVQETADGQVVVFHDSDFMKLAGVNLKIWDATLADLHDIDIGSRFDTKFKDERVPTLEEVLELCRGKVRVNIELKYYGHDQQLEQRVIQLVETHDMVSEIVLMSLKMDAVKKLKSIRPDWKVGLLMSVSAGRINNMEADFLAVNAQFATRNFIRSVHDSGKKVYVWTVNDAPTMSTMIGRGVDSLITDKPALARSVLEQRAQMSLPQRWMLELAGILGVAPEIGEP